MPIYGFNGVSTDQLATQFAPISYVEEAFATPVTDVQTFTVSDTWIKPVGAYLVTVTTVDGSGGGGSGRKGAAATVRAGGAGGGGGDVQFATYQASALADTVAVTIGTGGTGGAARTTNDTTGANGGQGTPSSFGAYLFGGFSGGGAGGAQAAAAGGFSAPPAMAQGTAGAGSSATGAAGSNSTRAVGGGGGGGGGGITAANAASNGGSAGGATTGTAGVVGGATPTNGGTIAATGTAAAGVSGGGGGASSITGNAQNGAAGALYGCGGGGGGAATNDVGNSGSGGAGAPGIVQVVTLIRPVVNLKPRVPPGVPVAGVTKLGVGTQDATTDLAAFLTSSQQTSISTWMGFTINNGTFTKLIRDIGTVNNTIGHTVPLEIAWGFPGSTTLAGIAAGNDDAYITARAKELRAYGGPVYLRLNWEMNGDWYAWASYTVNTPISGNTPTDYINAWRRIYGIVKQLAPNASFIWCPHLWVFHTQNPDLWYPGDSYVDWTAVTAYPGSATWDWVENGAWGLTPHAAFAVTHNKPFRICEWAVGQGTSTSDIGQFYQFKDWVDAHPVCREIVYFHMIGLNLIDYRLELYVDWQFAYRTYLTANSTRYPQS